MSAEKEKVFDDCAKKIRILKKVYLDEVEDKKELADVNQKLQLNCKITQEEIEKKQNVIDKLEDKIKILEE